MKTIVTKYRPKLTKMLRNPSKKDYDLYFSFVDDYDINYTFKKYPELSIKYEKWVRKQKLNIIEFISEKNNNK